MTQLNSPLREMNMVENGCQAIKAVKNIIERGNMAGFIRVLAGAGKVKNAAVLGLVLRAVGKDHRVYIARFLRPWLKEEGKGLVRLNGQVTIRQFGIMHDLGRGGEKIAKEGCAAAREVSDEIMRVLKSQEYSLVILDEVNVAACWGFLTIEDLLFLIELTPEKVELVLTGNCPDPQIIWQADSVTTFQEMKNNEKGYV